MLTFEALMDAAKEKGMPAGKIRGILLEYLQVLILKEMYKLPLGKNLYFTGGTYLRLVHQTRRFSEDLDFNIDKMSKHDFENILDKISGVLQKEGLKVKLLFKHWDNLFVSELIFPEVEAFYGIVSKYSKKEGISIKIETNRPKWKIKTETLVISGFGQMFPIVCTDRGALFADKIDALIKKNRARHLFDIMFMLSKKYPIDVRVLKSLGVNEPPLEAILKRVNNFSSAELKKQAESLRPFLFDENEADLLVNAQTIVPQLIKHYLNIIV